MRAGSLGGRGSLGRGLLRHLHHPPTSGALASPACQVILDVKRTVALAASNANRHNPKPLGPGDTFLPDRGLTPPLLNSDRLRATDHWIGSFPRAGTFFSPGREYLTGRGVVPHSKNCLFPLQLNCLLTHAPPRQRLRPCSKPPPEPASPRKHPGGEEKIRFPWGRKPQRLVIIRTKQTPGAERRPSWPHRV